MILTAGQIGRFKAVTSVIDSDEFVVLRGNSLFNLPADVLAAYIVAENTTTKELVFADSPYTVTALDDFINVDATGGSVVINFIALATVPMKPIFIRKNAGGANTVTLTADGSDLIDGNGTLTISSDGNAEMCVPFPTSWRTF